MTGKELIRKIRARALELDLEVLAFITPLSPSPSKWIRQLREAKFPKQHTIARVMALIEGREVPAPPPNNFQKSPARPAQHYVARPHGPVDDFPASVTRDPCFYCGTRADLGCKHRRAE